MFRRPHSPNTAKMPTSTEHIKATLTKTRSSAGESLYDALRRRSETEGATPVKVALLDGRCVRKILLDGVGLQTETGKNEEVFFCLGKGLATSVN